IFGLSIVDPKALSEHELLFLITETSADTVEDYAERLSRVRNAMQALPAGTPVKPNRAVEGGQ
ncbi:hypothetical protein FRB90_012825, partial [Tulasnella sp. 427]